MRTCAWSVPGAGWLGSIARSCVALANVVGTDAELNSTSELAAKLRPLTVISVGPAPASTVDGWMVVIAGIGGVTVSALGKTTSPASTWRRKPAGPTAAAAPDLNLHERL